MVDRIARRDGGDNMKKYWIHMKQDNKGIGVVEIILILVVLIALVIIFRDQITSLVSDVLGKISEGGNNIISTPVTIEP